MCTEEEEKRLNKLERRRLNKLILHAVGVYEWYESCEWTYEPKYRLRQAYDTVKLYVLAAIAGMQKTRERKWRMLQFKVEDVLFDLDDPPKTAVLPIRFSKPYVEVRSEPKCYDTVFVPSTGTMVHLPGHFCALGETPLQLQRTKFETLFQSLIDDADVMQEWAKVTTHYVDRIEQLNNIIGRLRSYFNGRQRELWFCVWHSAAKMPYNPPEVQEMKEFAQQMNQEIADLFKKFQV